MMVTKDNPNYLPAMQAAIDSALRWPVNGVVRCHVSWFSDRRECGIRQSGGEFDSSLVPNPEMDTTYG